MQSMINTYHDNSHHHESNTCSHIDGTKHRQEDDIAQRYIILPDEQYDIQLDSGHDR